MEKIVTIEGMKCEGCVKTVTEKFSELPTVEQVTVDLAGKTATIQSNEPITVAQLNDTLTETKFTVIR